MTSQLQPFENRDVLQATIRVTNAGDGLSQALACDPTEYHQGDTVYVILETEVARVAYEPLGDTGTLRRVHTLRAGLGTIVDGEQVAKALAAQRKANLDAQGVEELPGIGDDDGD